jgi:antitoxin VapB
MHTARIFKNGRSQAVRIPKDCAFDGVTELTVRREGQKLILEPVRKSWLSFLEEVEPADRDFMTDRRDFMEMDPKRVKF